MRTLRQKPLTAWLFAILLSAACSSSHDGGATDGTAAPPGPTPGGGNPPGDATPTPAPSGPTGNGNGEGDPPETPIAYVAYDLNHVVSTGQSNSVAHEGRPPISTTQPYDNLMFDVGVMTSGVCEAQGCRDYQKPTSLVPLTEGDTFWYPVETMSSGLANEATKLAKTKYGKPSHDILVSLAGRNGLTYWCLRKGGCNFIDPTYLNAFDENLKQVADGKAIAAAAGKSYVVRMVTAIHGESDDFAYATKTQEFPLDGTDGVAQEIKSYADGLIEWQRDYESNIQKITGQKEAVPLLISQFSGWNDNATSAVTQFQYDAHVKAKGKVVVVTPGYTLEWAGDCRHYTAAGEQHLGEYFGKAYSRIVFEGRRWEPVRPLKVTHAGNAITAKFAVPVPPLVLDTKRVVDPGHYGFEVVDAAGHGVAIANVALAGPDSVTVTLAAPAAVGQRLRYAFTGVPHTCPGPTAGARGNLRDSDDTPSQYGHELFNWGLHFEVPVE
ncbi:MAG: Endo,4-beta-xylanase precursor [Labilithrix sp.]|nr:Endo,4-beta-xylanase precursor [Labilithrix sp.]